MPIRVEVDVELPEPVAKSLDKILEYLLDEERANYYGMLEEKQGDREAVKDHIFCHLATIAEWMGYSRDDILDPEGLEETTALDFPF